MKSIPLLTKHAKNVPLIYTMGSEALQHKQQETFTSFWMQKLIQENSKQKALFEKKKWNIILIV